MSTAFLEQLYTSILGRTADTDGLAFWQNALDDGRLNASEVTAKFIASNEFSELVAPAARIYYAAFGRIPDADGLRYWAQQAQNGVSLSDICASFIESDEYQSLYGSAQDDSYFLDRLYENTFNRDPDSDGKAHWLDALNSGELTRNDVLIGFFNSVELTEKKTDDINSIAQYSGVLNYTPDQAEIDNLVRSSDPIGHITRLYASDQYDGETVPGLSKTGVVVDGYVSGATVTMTKPDGTVISVTTDANGNFDFGENAGYGPLAMTGGTDISTGKPFEGRMTAPAGATVVNPITTLIDQYAEQQFGDNASPGQMRNARRDVLEDLGLRKAVDALHYDPMHEASSSDNDSTATEEALAFQAAATQVNTLVTQVAALLEGAGVASDESAGGDRAVEALAELIGSGNLDLTDNDTIKQVATSAAVKATPDTSSQARIDAMADDAALTVANLNQAIQDAVDNAGTNHSGALQQIAQIQVVAESVEDRLEAGAALDDLTTARESTEGSRFTNAVEAERENVSVVDGVGAVYEEAPPQKPNPPSAPTEIELSDIANGRGGFVINGEAEGDNSGYSVASAGDVNGDGLDDLIVGASSASTADTQSAGRSYLVFGKNEGTTAVELSEVASGNGGYVINGEEPGDASGFSVASACDINGDGLADLLIGAYSADTDNGTYVGKSYVVFGKSDNTDAIDLVDIAGGSGGFVITGEAPLDWSGYSVASAGDFNGDGRNDLIIGAAHADPTQTSSMHGKSYLVYGKPDMTAVDLTEVAAGTGGFALESEGQFNVSGASVASAGDINGDGLADVIVGAPGASPEGAERAGKSYVIFGNATTEGTLDPANLGNNGFTINGAEIDDGSGSSVASAGDVNGDGLADLIIGTPGPYLSDNASRSYILFGSRDNADDVDLADLGSNGFVINGETDVGRSDLSVSSAGDINGDGLADLLVGINESDARTGKSYVVFGKADNTAVELSDVANGNGGFAINGETESDNSGISVSSAGDVNGDGLADLIVGANRADTTGGENSGRSYVIFGATNGVFRDSSVDSMGTVGDDTLSDNGTSTTLVGGQGNDTLTATSASVLYGGAGDDNMVIDSAMITALESGFGENSNDERLARIDGGSGADTLSLSDGDLQLDLTAIASQSGGNPNGGSRIDSIEKIDLTGSGNNSLNLSAVAVMGLAGFNSFETSGDSAGRHQLMITGDADADAQDRFTFADSGWHQGDDVTLDGVTYNVYNHSSKLATIYASENIGPDVTAPIPGITTDRIRPVDSATVQSNEAGTVYLVNSNVTVTNLASITSAPDTQWNSIEIANADQDTSLDAAGLTDGTYHLYALDGVGNLSSASSNSVVVDSQNPTASLIQSSVQPGSNVVARSTEIGTAYLISNDITVNDLGSIVGAADNQWNSVEITAADQGTNLDTTGLVDGTYYLYAVDEAGNLSARSANTISVDSQAPTATLTPASVQPGYSVWVRSSETGTAYLVNSNVIVTDLASITDAADDQWNSVSVNSADQDRTFMTRDLEDGVYYLYTADDAGNLSAASTDTVIVDSLAPTASVAAATVRSDDNVAVQSTEVGTAYLVNSNIDVTTVYNIIPADDDQWNSVSITDADQDTNLETAGLADGTYYVYAVDEANNTSVASLNSVTIDNQAPTATVTAETIQPGNNASVQSTEAGTAYLVHSSVSVSDLASITDAPSNQWKSTEISVADQDVSLSTSGLADGTYHLYVVDDVGNLSSASTEAITLDSQEPTASVTTATIRSSDSATVQSTETGTAYLVHSSISVSDLASITNAADDRWNSVDINAANQDTNLDATGLAAGTYHVYTVDEAGNLSSVSTSSVTIDGEAPSVSLTGATIRPSESATVQSTETGTVYLVNSNITVTNIASITDAADDQWNSVDITIADQNTDIDTTGLSDGTYHAYAVDAAGNISIASTNTITLDGQNPIAFVSTATIAPDTSISIQSNEIGTAYLVNNSITVTDLTSITDAATDQWESINITTADQDTTLDTIGLVDGMYRLYAIDGVGNLSSPSTNTVTIEGRNPTATLTEASIRPRDKATIQTSEPGKAYLVNTNVAVTDEDSITDAPSDQWNRTYPSKAYTDLQMSATGLIDGTYRLYTVDNASNMSEASTNAVTVDSQNPTVFVSEATIQPDVSVMVQSNEISTVYLVNSSVSVSDLDSITDAADEQWNSTPITTADQDTSLDTTGLADGIYHAYSIDAAGNLSSVSDNTVTIEGRSPIASLTSTSIQPGSNAVVQSNEAGTAYLVNSNVTVTDLASVTNAADDQWNSVDINVANQDTNLAATGLVNGTYHAYSVDAAGNLSSASNDTIEIDNEAPTATATTENIIWTTSTTVQSSETGTAYLVHSDINVTDVESITDARDNEWNSVEITVANQDFSLDAIGLAEGTYKVYTEDVAGNLSSASSETVTIGSPALWLSTITAGSGGFVVNGEAAGDSSGVRVSSAGDVNGDGLDDLIVGAYGAGPNGVVSGKSYVVFGKNDTSGVDLAAIAAGTGGFAINGEAEGDRSGFDVSSAGDVNGDGFADLLVGAYSSDTPHYASGRGYVIFGKSDTATVELSDIVAGTGGFSINGVTDRDLVGYDLSSAGDVNGDGLADVIIGSSMAGYVLFGKDDTSAIELSDVASGNGGFIVRGHEQFNRKYSVSNAGDVNGDGLSDVIVASGGTSDEPAQTYVVFGKEDTTAVDLSDFANSGASGFSIVNNWGSDDYSYIVSPAGDVNGDGLADLFFADTNDDRVRTNYGSGYVVFGKTSTDEVDLNALEGQGFYINGRKTGTSLASAGDINGDGLADLLISGTTGGTSGGFTNGGQSFIVFGKANDQTVDLENIDDQKWPRWSLTEGYDSGFAINGEADYDYSGTGVSSAGDVNGDGLIDFIIGASDSDPNGLEAAGKSYVIFGATDGVFSHTMVDTLGGDSDDSFNDNGISSTLVGGAGNDSLTASAASVLYGGAGDDNVVIDSNMITALESDFGAGGNDDRYARIDGGSGIDTITLSGSSLTLDLTAIANQAASDPNGGSRIDSIEKIDLTGSGDNALILTVQDLMDMTGFNIFEDSGTHAGRHQLMAVGDSGDSISFADSSWSQGDDVTLDGVTYEVYNHAESLATMYAYGASVFIV